MKVVLSPNVILKRKGEKIFNLAFLIRRLFLKKGEEEMSTVVNEVHQSWLGFHPCDKETFKKLKFLKKCYWSTVYAYARWKRWDRKLPKNRVIKKRGEDKVLRVVGPQPEPLFCPVFYQHGTITDFGILAEFQRARMPKKTLEEIEPLNKSPKWIDDMVKKCQEWGFN